ncbi:MAG: hypothetical protein MI685_09510 [Chlorobiales bacterium]|nr:hypothetical protein [Chlorobiales bacterium]
MNKQNSRKILEMIEDVDPDDEKTVDEINARVWAFFNLSKGNPRVSFNGGSIHYRYDHWDEDASTALVHKFEYSDYARSRDALKSIRPEGWELGLVPWTDNGRDLHSYTATLTHLEREPFFTAPAKTEELAELHAIIQAYIWEIENE